MHASSLPLLQLPSTEKKYNYSGTQTINSKKAKIQGTSVIKKIHRFIFIKIIYSIVVQAQELCELRIALNDQKEKILIY